MVDKNPCQSLVFCSSLFCLILIAFTFSVDFPPFFFLAVNVREYASVPVVTVTDVDRQSRKKVEVERLRKIG